jgi:hypothetical protein
MCGRRFEPLLGQLSDVGASCSSKVVGCFLCCSQIVSMRWRRFCYIALHNSFNSCHIDLRWFYLELIMIWQMTWCMLFDVCVCDTWAVTHDGWFLSGTYMTWCLTRCVMYHIWHMKVDTWCFVCYLISFMMQGRMHDEQCGVRCEIIHDMMYDVWYIYIYIYIYMYHMRCDTWFMFSECVIWDDR